MSYKLLNKKSYDALLTEKEKLELENSQVVPGDLGQGERRAEEAGSARGYVPVRQGLVTDVGSRTDRPRRSGPGDLLRGRESEFWALCLGRCHR